MSVLNENRNNKNLIGQNSQHQKEELLPAKSNENTTQLPPRQRTENHNQ